ncbi:uncharacterized protein ASPGLDRAFT_1244213 [Aspergillus glaucus CBS 516.65]|uniref:Uncharacterized protein n=1 Tax=Aspergillus glaucus CBS 516.65 TaxID=1160497 RepID=A0A1L9VRP2_ASPGL|nr:hypothetical protein ASPGLDRAFT_1244213 [Aspergillus glaucus CBS 516.65]OJJ86572.1 hypothetical protein ASPGLDRAFT_1244213 [Aspergillus glaucus CBS 516.65]
MGKALAYGVRRTYERTKSYRVVFPCYCIASPATVRSTHTGYGSRARWLEVSSLPSEISLSQPQYLNRWNRTKGEKRKSEDVRQKARPRLACQTSQPLRSKSVRVCVCVCLSLLFLVMAVRPSALLTACHSSSGSVFVSLGAASQLHPSVEWTG